MKAMILAAGFGTRMRPLTLHLPKPMIPVMNRPMLEHTLDLLRGQNITDLIINLHHLPEVVIDHFGDGSRFGVRIHWSREDAILGTAGGIKAAQRHLAGSAFVVMNSDVLAQIDLEQVLAFHREQGSVLTLVLKEGDSPESCDPIEMDEQNRIVHMPGVPSQNASETDHCYTFTGIQVMDPVIFDRIPEGVFSGTTTDVFPGMIADGLPVYGYVHDPYWIDIGQPSSYLRAHRDLLDGTAPCPNPPPSGDPGRATVIPPVHIGQNCRIAETARLGPYAVLGDGCVVEDEAVVETSVCWRGVTVKRGAAVRRSILGDGVTVQAGETCEGRTLAVQR